MKQWLLLIALSVSMAGCVALNTPITGALFNGSKVPGDVGTGERGAKVGTACSKGVLGVVWGDSTIEAAKAAGNISKVAYVDHTVTSVLLVYAEYCTVAHGD
jgi:hypothetical protein